VAGEMTAGEHCRDLTGRQPGFNPETASSSGKGTAGIRFEV
jgi:hypothetical protein